MPYIDKNQAGQITAIYANAQHEGQEFLEGAELYVSPPTPLQEIRAIESKPEVADAFVRATRQLLLGIWFERVKAKPAAANLTKEQIEAYCRASDPTYKTLAEAEDAIKPLRGKP